MKYFADNDAGVVYFMKDKQLAFMPMFNDGFFDTDEWSIVERPHEELSEEYLQSIITLLEKSYVN